MESIWKSEVDFKKRKSLDKDIECDTVIIGGGIAGLLIGYMLKECGIESIIIDAKLICSGNTKNTTAKITSQHELIYDNLIKEFGEEKAKHYALVNEEAIKKYKEIIEKENIYCDFKETDAYVYSLEENKPIEDEYNAAIKLGIDAELISEIPLPIQIKKALKFKHQAQFNPLEFLKPISEKLTVYENTKATDIDIHNNVVVTDKGYISAKRIIVATHYPFFNIPGYYFLKMHQERSYVLGLENASDFDGMYIGIEDNGYSYRTYKDLVLFGGANQRTGENEQGTAYETLRKAAKEIFPNCKERYHWSAQDCVSLDNIPYIGHYSTKTPNIYVATGFKKWGMTSSMVSAMIISDMIRGIDNEYADIFSPSRFDLSASMKNAGNDMAKTAKNFIAQKIHVPNEYLDDVKNGEGKIINYENKKVGVYKDVKGKIYTVSTKCPHLGCELKWNADEFTWDCPCHGSRFDYEGKWIEGPAKPTKSLK